MSPAIILSNVDLPEPVSPTTATVEPTGIEKLTSVKIGSSSLE